MTSRHEGDEYLQTPVHEAQLVENPVSSIDEEKLGEHRLNGHRRVGHGRRHQEESDGEEEEVEEEEEEEEEDEDEEDEDDEYEEEDEEEDDEDDEEPALKYERITGAIPELLKKDSASALAISHSMMVCLLRTSLNDFD